MRKIISLVLSSVLLSGMAAAAFHAGAISESTKAGPFTVTLKVLPAESFTGSGAAMVRDGGARAVTLHSRLRPDRHLVVFVRRNGKPVKHARVTIRYRRVQNGGQAWKTLPVVRMHVAGKGLATTHYGNNVNLLPGRYEVEVSVNGRKPAGFHFMYTAGSMSQDAD